MIGTNIMFDCEKDDLVQSTFTKGELHLARIAIIREANRSAENKTPTFQERAARMDALEAKLLDLLLKSVV